MRYHWHGELVGEIAPANLVLGGDAPQYTRQATEPAYRAAILAFDPAQVPVPDDLTAVTRALLAYPNIAHKGWVRRQYDSMVGAATLTGDRVADAALVHLHGTQKALAMTVDCNPRYVWADPYLGTAHAVAEAARNLVCTGAEPLGVTNCLNFGNPYNPEVYWQFQYAILGMKAACEALGLPVTGGNVSFYNQGPEGPVYPTPSIGMVGLVEDVALRMDLGFKAEGHLIYLLGATGDEIDGSEYLRSYHGVAHSPVPRLDLELEVNLQRAVLELIQTRIIASAHDVSDGGLMVALLESAFAHGLGFDVTSRPGIRKDAFLFGEVGSRVVVSLPEHLADDLKRLCAKHNVQFDRLGRVAGAAAVVDGQSHGTLADLEALYRSALAAHLQV